jgi:hypothetical protein
LSDVLEDPVNVPDPLSRWKAEGREFERKRRAATQRRHEQERADIMRNTPAASAPNDLDERIAAAIEAALKIERKNNRKVMAEVLAQLQHALDQRLEKAIRATDNLASRVTALADGGPDGNGIVRKQTITPH